MATAAFIQDRQQRIEAQAERVQWELQALVPPRREVRSAPDAREIPKQEICNIEPLTEDEVAEVDALLRTDCWESDDWDSWPESDQRWELTPHEAQKIKRRNVLHGVQIV